VTETLLYDRFITVSIGENGKTGKEFSDLKFTFKIDKFLDSTPNQLTLDIYNLQKSTYESFKKGMLLSLDCGYKEDHGIIFTGNIDLPVTKKQKPEIVTSIEIKDGLKSLVNSYVFKSFSANTDVSIIINYIISEMGLSKGTLSGIPVGKKILNGLSLAGSAKSYLDRFAKTYNFQWTINDGFIHIIKKGETINNTAILLDSTSGLLTGLDPTEKGFKVKSLLRWSVNPGHYVKIITGKTNDFFKVNNLTHSGDSRGNDWFTEMEVTKL
jgi:hypothetical protein